jgi:hypothetical protein
MDNQQFPLSKQTLFSLAAALAEVVKEKQLNGVDTVSLKEDTDGLYLISLSYDGLKSDSLMYLRRKLQPYTPWRTETSVTITAMEVWIKLVIGTPDEVSGMDYHEWKHEAGE